MDEPIFAGRLFKNNKNWWSVALIYVLFAVIFGLLALLVLSESKTVEWIAGGGLVVTLVTVGLSRKLTFNEPDDKNIYITRAGIAIGTEQYSLGEMAKLGIYVDAFYGFRYKQPGALNSYESSYGMDNWIYFRNGDKKHSYRFLIPNHEMYFLLEDILSAWRADGHAFAWEEKYGRTFVQQWTGRSR
jgi:hypothetical protein